MYGQSFSILFVNSNLQAEKISILNHSRLRLGKFRSLICNKIVSKPAIPAFTSVAVPYTANSNQ